MNFRLLALQHLLGSGLLAGLTLVTSLRFPEPGANRFLYLTLALQTAGAAGVIPLFRDTPPGRLIYVPLGLFVAGLLSFLVFVVMVTRERLRTRRAQRRR